MSTKKGDFSALPELHATSSGLKAYCSWATKDAIELCRLCCGGHGFMQIAGFGTTFGNYAPNATYEGDNNVLCLQTARFLLKVARAAAKAAARGTDVPAEEGAQGTSGYILEGGGGLEPGCQLGRSVGLREAEALLKAFAHAARRMIIAAATRAGTLTADQAMSRDMVAWIKAAKAHCAYVVLLNFVDAVDEAKPRVSVATAGVMDRLVALHALATMDDSMGDFLEDGHVSADQASAIRAEVAVLLAELRPDAAALVDSFALDDYLIKGAGRSKL